MSEQRVAVIGAGIGGLGMGIKLQQANIPFTIFEKAGEVGGTWRDNTYPGLRIDVPGPIYTYSTDRGADWSHLYVKGEQVQAYITGVCDRHGLRKRIRFDDEVVEARWDGERWHLRTAAGYEDDFDVVVQATGFLHHPRTPEIPGLEDFAGDWCHSARFDHDIALDGRRVGVIGNGSTGVQIVSELAGRASHLVSFQRSPQWIFPAPNVRIPDAIRRLLARRPRAAAQAARLTQYLGEGILGKAARGDGPQRRILAWAARRYLATVRDPELRRTLTPGDEPLCKRPVISTTYYRAVQRPDVEVTTAEIERIEPNGVVTADGRLHELDVLILATGFHAHNYMRPMNIIGTDGLTIDEAWKDGPGGYRTVGVAGFPNMFMIMGPHSPLVSIAIHTSVELQADYVLQALEKLDADGVVSVTPTSEASERWIEEVTAGMPGTVWATGCNSWYVGNAKAPVLWPFSEQRWLEMLRTPDWADYEISRRETANERESASAR